MEGIFYCMVQMPFSPILSYNYCHDITSDRFFHPPTNGHNEIIHDGFSMNVTAKLVKNLFMTIDPVVSLKKQEKNFNF